MNMGPFDKSACNYMKTIEPIRHEREGLGRHRQNLTPEIRLEHPLEAFPPQSTTYAFPWKDHGLEHPSEAVYPSHDKAS